MTEINRRNFLASATAATVALATRSTAHAAGANDDVALAFMGVNSRGSQLATQFAQQAGARIAYICDCDERAIGKGIEAATSKGAPKPKGIKDFRQALDDPAVDAIICAAPNHWHAPATILGCAAGKHVYVEKPVSHLPAEGERMIAAGRSANRVVQAGLQRRSAPSYRKAIGRLHDGMIGKVLYARSTYHADRPSIGHGKKTDVPAWLDYELWQGPAPARPFQDNVVHYNWHWFWNWGNGELGNNGVHTIDVCRWGLGVDYPSRVTAAGSKLRWDDDQETPDTCTVTFDCDGRTIVWEGISWSRNEESVHMEFRGEGGSLFVDDNGYTIYDQKRKLIEQEKIKRTDGEHMQAFLDAIRTGSQPGCDIEDGHKSTMFCHLGNIAYRTGQSLEIDPTTGHIRNNTAAEALWDCEYRKGWLPEA